MTDHELRTWWPDFGLVVAGLRHLNHADQADRLLDAVAAGGNRTTLRMVDGEAQLTHGKPMLDAGLALLLKSLRALPQGHWQGDLITFQRGFNVTQVKHVTMKPPMLDRCNQNDRLAR